MEVRGDALNESDGHFMSITWEAAAFEGCDLQTPEAVAGTTLLFEEGDVSARASVPNPPIASKGIVRSWPLVSGKQAAEIASAMSEDERATLREQVRRDAFPLNAMYLRSMTVTSCPKARRLSCSTGCARWARQAERPINFEGRDESVSPDTECKPSNERNGLQSRSIRTSPLPRVRRLPRD